VRLFAICCYAVALFYGWTAADAMWTGVSRPLSGAATEHRRDDPQSQFRRYMIARWMYCGGFAALGVVMQVFAGRFEKLEGDDGK
jgi:hypothetical protein